MIIVVVISIFFNVMLVLYLRTKSQENQSLDRTYETAKLALDNMSSQRDKLTEVITAMAHAVAVSLKEIRDDIDANYQHIHIGSTLDQLIGELHRTLDARGEMEVGNRKVVGILLTESVARAVLAKGGQVHEGNVMDLAQMLEFAWMLHTRAKDRSEKLFAVVKEPCGDPDHAAWLAKTLAIYERICGGDVGLAVARLTAVTHAWKHEPSFVAARATNVISG